LRLVNRLLAALLSVALIALGALIVIEVVANRTRHKYAAIRWHSAYEWLDRTIWQAGSVRVISIALLVLGLVLLALELKRSRPSRLQVVGEDNIDAGYTRRGVVAALHSSVTDVDGISSAAVKVSRRKARVRAVAAAQDVEVARQLREPAVAAAQARLDALRLKKAPALAVRVAPRSN
jgi:hypothetical protein